MRRLFGTDGVRGVANRDLTPEMALALGRAAGRVFHRGETRPFCVVGKDSRLSGDMLEAALTAGLLAEGVDVRAVGVLPTPAVSYLVQHWGAAAGAVISASHNPVEDNGIKFFGRDGQKLPDATEEAIEAAMDLPVPGEAPIGVGLGRREEDVARAKALYVAELRRRAEGVLPGTVVIDAAFGAAAAVAQDVWQGLAERLVVVNGTPDGRRINVACGSTHPDVLASAVSAYGAQLGLAFDGDADRLIAVDEQGRVVDGDHLLYLFARYLKERGELGRPQVAVTVMSNLGLRRKLAEEGIGVVETPVGDRYVMEALVEGGLTLGGEPSGHIVVRSRAKTGDGLLSSLLLREALLYFQTPLSVWRDAVPRYPQGLYNIPVVDKAAFLRLPEVRAIQEQAEDRLGAEGRILIRASGTEPCVRVMVEAREEGLLRAVLRDVVTALEELAGGAGALLPTEGRSI